MAKNITINKDRILITETVNLYIPFFGSFPFTFTKFDTNALYLKTDPNGSLSVGGYTQCPTFYGTSADANVGISDKDNGWFPSDLVRGTITSNMNTSPVVNTWYLDLSSASVRKLVRNPAVSGGAATYYSPSKSVYLNGSYAGSFQYVLEYIQTGVTQQYDGETGYYDVPSYGWAISIINVSILNSLSGVFQFENQDMKYMRSGSNGTSGGYFFQEQDTNVNVIIRPFCMQSLRNPTTLSIAVTP